MSEIDHRQHPINHAVAKGYKGVNRAQLDRIDRLLREIGHLRRSKLTWIFEPICPEVTRLAGFSRAVFNDSAALRLRIGDPGKLSILDLQDDGALNGVSGAGELHRARDSFIFLDLG